MTYEDAANGMRVKANPYSMTTYRIKSYSRNMAVIEAEDGETSCVPLRLIDPIPLPQKQFDVVFTMPGGGLVRVPCGYNRELAFKAAANMSDCPATILCGGAPCAAREDAGKPLVWLKL